MKNRSRQNGFIRAVKRFFLSAFVLVTFIAYALENRATAGGAGPTPGGSTAKAAGTAPGAATSVAAAAPTAAAPANGASSSASNPTGTSGTGSGYKNGTYTGPAVYVNWGYVQIQATIQNGKISNVQFLQYPNDRRTSVRINSFANPVLQQEAIQAQSANVDLITGATLTSEGFQQSLQGALSLARS